MKIKVIEYSGEVGKIREILNYSFIINFKDPGFKEQFFEDREKALKKYLEMKEEIRKEILKWDISI